MKRFYFLIIGFQLLSHSGFTQSLNEKIIKIKGDVTNTGPIKMSEIISEIKYIPLETNPNCLIGSMNIPVYGKDILIRSHTSSINGEVSILRFSDKGKYLNKIGKMGAGPEEYMGNVDVVLIGDTVIVVSGLSDVIYYYHLSGSFITRYHLNTTDGARPMNIVQLPDKSYFISLSHPGSLGILLKTDNDFNVKTGFFKNVSLKNNPLSNGFPRSGNKIFYFYNFMDTIFEISKGYPVPEIVVDYGKYRVSDNAKNITSNKLSIFSFYSDDNYLKLNLYYPMRGSITILYRIKDGKQISWTRLINDIDNGTYEDRWNGFVFLFENNLICQLMASTVLERFSKMTQAEKLNPKNSSFVNMASKITLHSNPIIMICKLKE